MPSGLLLLGCVKLKRDTAQAAKDLYCSPLWTARRGYAEASGRPWFIVSAFYGLIEPDEQIAPYDLALAELSAADRRAWAEQVVSSLERRFGTLTGATVEIHAGGAYRRALEPLLRARGASPQSPTATISGVGTQIAWYSRQQPAQRRRLAHSRELAAALKDLDEAPHIVPAADWPSNLSSLAEPGLYSWWVDREGAAMLSEGLDAEIAEGRIYAGLTGATKWPSGITGKNTLQKRIGGSHIRGRIRGSTFRLTLASVLRDQLGLIAIGPKLLASRSETALTAWIRQHLSVAVHPFPADPLADLEHRVLAHLDPPLNLDGMQSTPVRSRLAELRQVLSHAPTTRLSTQIGGGPDGYYTVDGDGEQLTWRGPPEERDTEQEVVEVKPRPEDWQEFWQTLDRLKVWDWDGREYETPGVRDGTHWSLEAVHAGRIVGTDGDNGYPDSDSPEPSERFSRFCVAVSELAGGRPFE